MVDCWYTPTSMHTQYEKKYNNNTCSGGLAIGTFYVLFCLDSIRFVFSRSLFRSCCSFLSFASVGSCFVESFMHSINHFFGSCFDFSYPSISSQHKHHYWLPIDYYFIWMAIGLCVPTQTHTKRKKENALMRFFDDIASSSLSLEIGTPTVKRKRKYIRSVRSVKKFNLWREWVQTTAMRKRKEEEERNEPTNERTQKMRCPNNSHFFVNVGLIENRLDDDEVDNRMFYRRR